MAVQKNMYMEAWNGKREITERSFAITSGQDVSTLIACMLLFPYGVYTWSRAEFASRVRNPEDHDVDERYKDLV